MTSEELQAASWKLAVGHWALEAGSWELGQCQGQRSGGAARSQPFPAGMLALLDEGRRAGQAEQAASDGGGRQRGLAAATTLRARNDRATPARETTRARAEQWPPGEPRTWPTGIESKPLNPKVDLAVPLPRFHISWAASDLAWPYGLGPLPPGEQPAPSACGTVAGVARG